MGKGAYIKPDLLAYRTVQLASGVLARFVFRRRFIRNEIKNVDGPYAVIANHQCALDFVTLIGATRKRLTFVLSNSFYSSLPVRGLLDRMGIIPKQQFETTVSAMNKIKAVIENGESLVIYPAGLMCEDGVSTPIPEATYKFLKWLDTDIYAARTTGTYFAMPKWSSGMRPGKTFLDIYLLIPQAGLREMSVEEVKAAVNGALLFNAYEEQRRLMIKYKNGSNIEGLENVLYMCPNCMSEFTMKVKDGSTIYCEHCGYTERSDEFAFLHNDLGIGRELRHVPDWSRFIYDSVKKRIAADPSYSIEAKTKFHMINHEKHRFEAVGEGSVKLSRRHFNLKGRINGKDIDLEIPSAKLPTLPFKPGKNIEVQHGQDIYRCVLDDGRLAMKFINILKAFHELNNANA